ncbi:unannotated protein [freshwater metagenome]|uniref:Unannotated protein n=1 Tax=freshwater metagenome TaxID=449393 RepID=A0A6J7IW27_9ZZZZ
MNEDGLPRLKLASAHEAKLHREVVHARSRAYFEGNRVGQGQDEVLGDSDGLGEPTQHRERHDSVTGCEFRRRWGAANYARYLGPWDVGKFWLHLVHALGLQQFRETHARNMHVNQHLAGGRAGLINVDESDLCGAVEIRNMNCSHKSSWSMWVAACHNHFRFCPR